MIARVGGVGYSPTYVILLPESAFTMVTRIDREVAFRALFVDAIELSRNVRKAPCNGLRSARLRI